MWIRWTPPVSRKKFHLPQRASQSRTGTKCDRVQPLKVAPLAKERYKTPFFISLFQISIKTKWSTGCLTLKLHRPLPVRPHRNSRCSPHVFQKEIILDRNHRVKHKACFTSNVRLPKTYDKRINEIKSERTFGSSCCYFQIKKVGTRVKRSVKFIFKGKGHPIKCLDMFREDARVTPTHSQLCARGNWVVSITLRSLYPVKHPVSLVQEVGWGLGAGLDDKTFSSPIGIQSRTVRLVTR